jgi:hypothetical protein
MSLRWFLLSLLVATPAVAHDWYPLECCHGIDCAPVEHVEITQNATMIVTSKHGSAVVPATFPRRESKDNRMHVCMRPGEAGAMRLICIFFPPST